MMVIRKKNIVLTALVLLLCVLVYANYRLNNHQPTFSDQLEDMKDFSGFSNEKNNDTSLLTLEGANESIENSIASSSSFIVNFIVDASMNRESTRSESIRLLNEVINSSSASEADRARAVSTKMNIAEIMNKEVNIETQLKANGYNSIVLLGENNATVIVGTSERLKDKDVAIIKNIVITETKLAAKDIRIKDDIIENTKK